MVSFICVDNGTVGKNNGISAIKKLTLYTRSNVLCYGDIPAELFLRIIINLRC